MSDETSKNYTPPAEQSAGEDKDAVATTAAAENGGSTQPKIEVHNHITSPLQKPQESVDEKPPAEKMPIGDNPPPPPKKLGLVWLVSGGAAVVAGVILHLVNRR